MASLVAQGISSSCGKFSQFKLPITILTRQSSAKNPRQLEIMPERGTIKNRFLIDKDCQSLPDCWYLRNQKPYYPPPDAETKVDSIVKEVLGEESKSGDVIPENLKYPLLDKCWKEFLHAVPNPLLHEINTVADVHKFYKTEIQTKTPYELLVEKDLPPNLHIIEDYVRYDPENPSSLFSKTAHPGRPTVVTGLRARKKYKSHFTRLPYNYFNEAVYVRYNDSN